MDYQGADPELLKAEPPGRLVGRSVCLLELSLRRWGCAKNTYWETLRVGVSQGVCILTWMTTSLAARRYRVLSPSSTRRQATVSVPLFSPQKGKQLAVKPSWRPNRISRNCSGCKQPAGCPSRMQWLRYERCSSSVCVGQFCLYRHLCIRQTNPWPRGEDKPNKRPSKK